MLRTANNGDATGYQHRGAVYDVGKSADLLNAAVTVRVRGWKGNKQKPEIEKTVELRLSVRAIAMRYVMDKCEEKMVYNKDSRRKEPRPAEWKEEDINILPNGWVEPKEYKKRIAMMSYLTDQYSFLDRTAESKAERRVNLKLLGFDWRDPDEITDETRDVSGVQKQEQETFDVAGFLTRIETSTEDELSAINESLPAVLGKLSIDDRDKIIATISKRKDELKKLEPKSVDPKPAEPKAKTRKSMFEKEREPESSAPVEPEVITPAAK